MDPRTRNQKPFNLAQLLPFLKKSAHKRKRWRSKASPPEHRHRFKLQQDYDLVSASFMSSSSCLFAFLTSDLELAVGSRAPMALPRLIEPVPVTLAFKASKPPGLSRFFATCAAATH